MTINDVKNYIKEIYKETKDRRLGNPKVYIDIQERLNKASKITNLPIPELLSRLDFKYNDKTVEALESFLAELRSIFWLNDFGFTNITPLGATKKPQPDFTAKYSRKSCVVEVFCLTQTHEQQKDKKLNVYVNFDPNFEGSKFGRDFMSKATEKKVQLDAINTKIKVLLCVTNSDPILSLDDMQDMRFHAQFLHNKLNWGNGYFVGLLTGVSVNGKRTDAIYPRLN